MYAKDAAANIKEWLDLIQSNNRKNLNCMIFSGINILFASGTLLLHCSTYELNTLTDRLQDPKNYHIENTKIITKLRPPHSERFKEK